MQDLSQTLLFIDRRMFLGHGWGDTLPRLLSSCKQYRSNENDGAASLHVKRLYFIQLGIFDAPYTLRF